MGFSSFIYKKYSRLMSSRNILKINYIFHKIFGDHKLGNLGLDFTDKPKRQFIVQDIINRKNFKSYLEIGCFDNELFNIVNCDKKVGVDPATGGNVRKTSDAYFKDCNDKFDCIFIDGLHTYSQVIKDINNSLNILNHGGIILLHDCLPNNYFDQAVPRCQFNWNGDVWRAIVECRTKKDLDTYTCYADFGIGVIFKRENQNYLDLAIKDFSKINFKEYFDNYKKLMNLIEYDDLIKII